MSNVGRPRTGLKPCPHDGRTSRDSNGQCACRNALYRLVQRAATADQKKVKKVFDDALIKGASIEGATTAVRQRFAYLAPKKAAPKKAAPKKAAPKKAAPKKAAPKKAEPARYLLAVEGLEGKKPYARKDAAVKNGVRSGQGWIVTYKGKVVATSDDLL